MRIHTIGVGSGTEPIPGYHHVCWVLETGGKLYWFDAGENCSYNGVMMGLDLLKIRAIFISHPHMDHVGGLGNLLWCVRKYTTVLKKYDPFTISIRTPLLSQLENVLGVLSETEGNFKSCFTIDAKPVQDGLVYDDGQVRVEARHNRHLGIPADGVWKSFSYRIQAEGKTIVYSGDTGSVSDLGDWPEDCDLFLMESGHHSPPAVAAELRGGNCRIGKLMFIHHGLELLHDPEGVRARASAAWGAPVEVAAEMSSFDL